jgi:site-specific recombinase XerD
LDRVREALRARHYSLRTEASYTGWIRRFILFHPKRHPAEMGEVEINRFLTHPAVGRDMSAATQNQAMSAILFLYQKVLEKDLGPLEGLVRAKKPARLPVVLSREEVRALLEGMSGPARPAM